MKKSLLPIAIFGWFIGGCVVGPNFVRPEAETPGNFKNSATKSDASAPNALSPGIDSWWTVFGDIKLNELETSALEHSPEIAAAFARVDEGRAQLGITRADRLPSVNGAPQIIAAGQSAAQNASINGKSISFRPALEKYSLPFSASYQIDLWGRVRRSIESGEASLQASEADKRGVLLTLTCDVAQYYFSLRELDLEIKIVGDTAHRRRDTLDVQTARFRGGLINELDVQRARVQAATVEADVASLGQSREQTADALAVTTGRPPSELSFNFDPLLPSTPPSIPAGIPAELLERRPDLAESEAILHARTAEIGVAAANQFPVVSLFGNAGFLSADAGEVFNPVSQFWNVGPSVTIPIFTGGKLVSRTEIATAQAAEASAQYRRSALLAIREVEDNLVAIRQQSLEGKAQDEAQSAATATAKIAQERYERGLANYLDVTDADNSLLQIQRAQAELAGTRYASTINLIKALGGAW